MKSKVNVVFGLIIILILSGTVSPARAQSGAQDYYIRINEYQANSNFWLYIPARNGVEIPVVKGVVVVCPGSGGSDYYNNEWDRWLYDHAFAYVSKRNSTSTPSPDLAATLSSQATARSRPELANVPWCITGVSMGGQFSWKTAYDNPTRTIGFMPYHWAGWYSGKIYTPTAAQMAVPALFHNGEGDPDYGVECATAWKAGRDQGALWGLMFDWNRNHNDWPELFATCALFFDECIRLRYPYQTGIAGKDPKLGAVTLTALTENSGWLGEHITGSFNYLNTATMGGVGNMWGQPNGNQDFNTTNPYIASYASFEHPSPKTTHSWFPSERIAQLWRSHVNTGFAYISISYPTICDNATYVEIPLITIGQTVPAVVDARGFPGTVAKVEFYDNETKRGEVSAAPYSYSFAFTAPGLHRLWAVVVGVDGNKVVTGEAITNRLIRSVMVQSDTLAGNHAPTIAITNNQQVVSSGQVVTWNFTVSDAETAVDQLGVTFRPVANWVAASTISGTGSQRTLTVTLNSGMAAGAKYGGIIMVRDGTIGVNAQIQVSVPKSGSAPSFTEYRVPALLRGPDVIWRVSSVPVEDADTPLENLVTSVTNSSIPALLTLPEDVRWQGWGGYRLLYYRLKPGGYSTLTLSLSDGSTTVTSPFEVNPMLINNGNGAQLWSINGSPYITAIAAVNAVAGVASTPSFFRVADFKFIPEELPVSAVSSNQTLLPNANITLKNFGHWRSVSVRPAAGQTGTATVTVTVNDTIDHLTAVQTFVVNVSGPTGIAYRKPGLAFAGSRVGQNQYVNLLGRVIPSAEVVKRPLATRICKTKTGNDFLLLFR